MKSCWYGVTVGARCGEALGPPFSRTARYKFRSAIPYFKGAVEAAEGSGIIPIFLTALIPDQARPALTR